MAAQWKWSSNAIAPAPAPGHSLCFAAAHGRAAILPRQVGGTAIFKLNGFVIGPTMAAHGHRTVAYLPFP